MTTTKIDVQTKEKREAFSAEIAKQVEEFLANGGTITECPPRTFTKTEGPKRKFDGGQFDSLTDPSNRDIGAVRPSKNKGGNE